MSDADEKTLVALKQLVDGLQQPFEHISLYPTRHPVDTEDGTHYETGYELTVFRKPRGLPAIHTHYDDESFVGVIMKATKKESER